MAPDVRVHGLLKRYGDAVAVSGVSFEVEPGQVFGLLGANGAGKTTTLELIAGLRTPDEGSIEVCGLDAIVDPGRIRRLIGMQLQATAVFETLTVQETLKLFASFYDLHGPVDEALDAAQLADRRHARAGTLSVGQRQRLSLALALLHKPRVLLLDEPTASLDPQARRHIWDVLDAARRDGVTAILSTHDLQEAQTLCDRIAILEAGRILACGSPTELVARSGAAAHVELASAGVPPEVAENLSAGPVWWRDGRVSLRSARPEQTVDDLLAAARRHGFVVRDLVVRPASLEDAFLNLTGRTLSD